MFGLPSTVGHGVSMVGKGPTVAAHHDHWAADLRALAPYRYRPPRALVRRSSNVCLSGVARIEQCEIDLHDISVSASCPQSHFRCAHRLQTQCDVSLCPRRALHFGIRQAAMAARCSARACGGLCIVRDRALAEVLPLGEDRGPIQCLCVWGLRSMTPPWASGQLLSSAHCEA